MVRPLSAHEVFLWPIIYAADKMQAFQWPFPLLSLQPESIIMPSAAPLDTRQSICNNISNFSRVRKAASRDPREASEKLLPTVSRAQQEALRHNGPAPLTLEDRHWPPPLFTAHSIFPTLDLPLPGAAPRTLDGPDEYKYGQKVYVREFDNVGLKWTPWTAAYVVDSTYFYGAAGSRAQCYHVCTNSARPDMEVSRPYFPLLAEICPADRPFPEGASPEKCAEIWRMLHAVLVRLHDPGEYCGVPRDQIWIPGLLVSFEPPTSVKVKAMAHPFDGKIIDVKTVLPYTFESMAACRGWGYHVLNFDGSLIPPTNPAQEEEHENRTAAQNGRRKPPIPWAHAGLEQGDTGYVQIGSRRLPTFACPKLPPTGSQ
ncbi:uncharacterized protein SCHCODRAFT_02572669 [Schizophyllum commune H4-8]|uniref:uncharacterized protein n=1 Tax=Schizophyllum commune (strain H4-8 / FGSC 9210) TaxID=578458 RepID=UPI00215FED31|nr:uncharacterized protein SCHCODRAFT_02572669 [Schizophyllum commune H4-8]KAI5895281.1 hypothetical protein SCHCODRAFT_02572669 [Schizophyllum commune H4-8]